jgi:hypothetical protein
MIRNGSCLLVAALSAATLLGCETASPDNVGKVSGKVTLEGQPLPDATVKFSPIREGGSSALGRTDADGKYSLNYASGIEGAEIGENRVSISTYNAGDPDGEPPQPKVLEKVPMKYNIRSELTREVNAGDNPIDFDLKTDGPIIADPSKISDRSSDGC